MNGEPKKPTYTLQPEELILFLEQVFALDQEASHINAPDCLRRLQEHENEFKGTDHEDRYWYLISLECLHIAQVAAQESRTEEAVTMLQQAIAAAMKQDDADWTRYLEATLAYLQSDVGKVRELKDRCGMNSKTVSRLLHGLDARGSSDYARDY